MSKNLFFIVLSIMCLCSCDVFSPREAEPPVGRAKWHMYANTPEKCLDNLVFSYTFPENAINYSKILSSNFEFIFDPQDVADFTFPARWGRQSEESMLMNFHYSGGAYPHQNLALSSIPNQNDDIAANSVWVYRKYEFYLSRSDTVYEGKMQLLLEKEHDGSWRIRQWFDFRDQNELTWGRMKNAFA